MRIRRLHYIVWHEDDIMKLITFTHCPLVEKFAYIKHQGDSDCRTHYHFYFVIRGSEELPSKLNGVNDTYCVGCFNKESAILDYFLNSSHRCQIDKQSFRTNIESYKKYNGV